MEREGDCERSEEREETLLPLEEEKGLKLRDSCLRKVGDSPEFPAGKTTLSFVLLQNDLSEFVDLPLSRESLLGNPSLLRRREGLSCEESSESPEEPVKNL